jgi:polysaccharide biosynthesis/export protein
MKTLAMLLSGCVLAQNRPPGVVDTNIANVANLPAQKISANDLLAVSVYEAPELTRSIRVDADGTIRVPMLKKRLQAEGLMPAQLESAIVEGLKAEEILVDPIVTVTIMEYDSRPISVIGAVNKPLTFQAAGKVTLLDALTKAEGLTSEAGPEILIMRPARGATDSTAALQRVPIKQLMSGANPELNFPLTGGEEIRVPEARKIYIVGNVRKPGAISVRDAAGMTVLKVLAVAEGLAPYASKTAYIYRGADPVMKQELAIELDKILERKAPDIALQADDIMYIPDNKTRRNAMTVIDRVTGFGASTASGILIWRH